MLPTIKVQVHYRRLYRPSSCSIPSPLADGITKALRSTIDGVEIYSNPRLRTFTDSDGSTLILNGRLITTNGLVFGELIRLSANADIPLLMSTATADGELEIKSATKPNDAEFVSGMCFFLISGDSVLLVERDLGFPALESYSRWLLCTKTSIAGRDERVRLIPSTLLDPQHHPIKSVRSVKVSPPHLQYGGMVEAELNSHASGGSRGRGVLDILKAALLDPGEVEKIALRHNVSVDVSVQILFRQGRNVVSVNGEEASALLRNIPEEDLIVEGEHSRKNRGQLERLKKPVTVERKGNILDRGNVWSRLAEIESEYKMNGLLDG